MTSYKTFFGLTAAPFTQQLAPAAILAYGDLAQCHAGLQVLVEDGGIGLLVGRMGTGKTTAIRSFVATLDPTRVRPLYLPSAADVRSLLRQMALVCGITPNFQIADLRLQIVDFLRQSYRRQACTTLLLADEAHLYNEAQLTELRLLTQLGLDSDEPVRLLLIGHPSLRQNLRRSSQMALRQRLTFYHALAGLSREETQAYIAAHLHAVGGDPAIFPNEVVEQAWTVAEGMPRVLNLLLNQSLQKAAWRQENPVSLTALEQVLEWRKDL